MMRCLPAGAEAMLVEMEALAPVLALLRRLLRTPLPGVVEMVPAARTLMLRFDPHLTSAARLAAALEALPPDAGEDAADATGREITIPVRYDGQDMAEVATLTGLTPTEIVARHTGTSWLAAFAGFAPGFCYLTGGDPALNVPRRASPRKAIPAGSVALAGAFSGIYPQSSPGGWQIIGTTALRMWDVNRDPPALIAPGDRVWFVADDGSDAAPVPAARPATDAAPPGANGPALTVLAAPLPALVQDMGRPGLMAQGIARSGAADRGALSALNSVLGNAAGAPALELVGGGFRARAERAAEIAVTGAASGLAVNGVLHVPAGRAVALDPGDEVEVTAAPGGLYAYLGLRGGFAVAPVLGSAATDTLAGIGPAPVGAGTRLVRAKDRAGPLGHPAILPALPCAGDLVTLDVIMGPRSDWFTDVAVASFLAQDWLVSAACSRVGKRLEGEALTRAPHPDGAHLSPPELPSEATVRGAVQVPHSGQPVLFLADHPLTGGYPVIAVVVPADLDRAAQIPPGARLRFRALSSFAPVLPRGTP